MSIKSDVLRDLVKEWKESSGEKKRRIFDIILARVDRLLIDRANRLKRSRPQLATVGSQDLYHCAIVGLYRALKSTKEKDSGDTIQAKILSYAKEEIRKTYIRKGRISIIIDQSLEIAAPTFNGPEFSRIESNEIIGLIKEMIRKGNLSGEDFKMLIENSVHGLTYREIGRRRGMHYTTVSRRVRKLKKMVLERLNG